MVKYVMQITSNQQSSIVIVLQLLCRDGTTQHLQMCTTLSLHSLTSVLSNAKGTTPELKGPTIWKNIHMHMQQVLQGRQARNLQVIVPQTCEIHAAIGAVAPRYIDW